MTLPINPPIQPITHITTHTQQYMTPPSIHPSTLSPILPPIRNSLFPYYPYSTNLNYFLLVYIYLIFSISHDSTNEWIHLPNHPYYHPYGMGPSTQSLSLWVVGTTLDMRRSPGGDVRDAQDNVEMMRMSPGVVLLEIG